MSSLVFKMPVISSRHMLDIAAPIIVMRDSKAGHPFPYFEQGGFVAYGSKDMWLQYLVGILPIELSPVKPYANNATSNLFRKSSTPMAVGKC